MSQHQSATGSATVGQRPPAFPPIPAPAPIRHRIQPWRLQSNGEAQPGLLASLAAVKADARVRNPWIAFNNATAVNLVWIDIDHQGWSERLTRAIAAGLPSPAYTCASARGAHIAWVLRTPVLMNATTARGARCRRLLSLTQAHLVSAFEADPVAALGGLTKNPWHRRWTTEVHEWEVHDLHDLLAPLKALAAAEKRMVPGFRHASVRSEALKGNRLWNEARKQVYAASLTDPVAILELVQRTARGIGSPAEPRQIEGMARCIACFMRTKWRGWIRVAPLTADEIKQRQSAAGRRTTDTRNAKRSVRLDEALRRLSAAGIEPTNLQLAQASGLSVRTVQRVRRQIAEVRTATIDVPACESSIDLVEPPCTLPASTAPGLSGGSWD